MRYACFFFCFKQKTAYEMRISDWSSDVCSSDLNDRGVTVVLTTHYLEEAEELCDRIAIINHGKLIANKPTRELVDMAREKIVVVTLDQDVTTLPTERQSGG